MDRNSAVKNSALTLAGEGLRLLKQGLWHDAEGKFRAALAADPADFDALHNLGIALLQQRRPQEAVRVLNAALARRPEAPEVHNNLSLAYQVLGREAEAAGHLKHFVALKPDHMPALDRLVSLLVRDLHLGEALDVLESAAALRPGLAVVHHQRANLLRTLGRLDEARAAAEQALAADPASGQGYYLLADLKRFTAGDPQLATMRELSRRTLPPNEQIALLFALGKAYVDIGRHDDAFALFGEANRLMRRSVAYDEARTLAALDEVKRAFTPELLRSLAGLGDPSTLPVFVLGMPRSGTTLVEQILASHPLVAGAGETTVLSRLVETFARDFPAGMQTLDARTLREFASGYLLGMGKLLGGVERIVDKTLNNVMYAGLAHLVFPNARFIWVVRDPVDTCLSCFSRRFLEGVPYACDLAELGRYYRAAEGLMTHWERLLAPETTIKVRYEDVVADLEGQARRLIAHCGLEWDDACLSFYRADRPVFTASAAQVRWPLYRTAVGRWKPTPHLLKPLLDALE